MKPPKDIRSLRWVTAGYASHVLIGWALLSLPICWADENPGWIHNLFVSISAVSTTGLTTLSIEDTYSRWGEAVILLLIQAGGIGYMSLGSFVILTTQRSLPESNEAVTKAVFDLPEGWSTRTFLRNVVTFTFGIEAIGFIFLWYAFARHDVESPAWQALFHSVSAFCTAGLSLFPDSLQRFQSDFLIITVIALLALVGAIGFLVMSDLFGIASGEKGRQSLTTRVILEATALVTIGGMIVLLFAEPSYRAMPLGDRILAAGFQTITSLATVGFDTTPMPSLHDASLWILLFLMIFGTSPSGTGGGVRITALSAAAATMWTIVRRRNSIELAGRKIPRYRVDIAFVSIVFYLGLVFVGTFLLLIIQAGSFRETLFEVVSAVSTVGLSLGLTSKLNDTSMAIIMALMFIGRTGPITIGSAAFALSTHRSGEHVTDGKDQPEEDLAVD